MSFRLTASLDCCFNQRQFRLSVTQLHTDAVRRRLVAAGYVEETRTVQRFYFTLVSCSTSCSVWLMCLRDQKKNQSHEAAEGFMASDLRLICLQETGSDSHLKSERKHHSVQLCFI